jgi:hypothetical protein
MLMGKRRIRLSRASGVTSAEFEDALAQAWSELRRPASRPYALAKDIVDAPENSLPAAVDEVASVVPEAQHLDAATGAVIVIAWLGERVAEKVFDMLWDRVIVPWIEERLGKGSFSEEPGEDPPGQSK